MKKKLLTLMLAVLVLFSFTACSNSKETTKDKDKDEVKAEKQLETADEFYAKMQNLKNVRPIAVMIDNDTDDARPQMGLESAYMVYEIVVEGKATRFMALFKDFELDKVGPVRSSRHYFLDYALENNAIYAHAGWSPKAAKDISSLGVNNINGVAADGDIYWRDNTYDNTWHNLYTSTKNLSERADRKGYSRNNDGMLLEYNPEDTVPEGESVSEISIPYADFYQVSYKYDENAKNFVRYVNGKTHDSQTGNALTAKNIIMYTVQNVNLPDTENKGRQDLKNIGSGTGYYFSDGKVVEIKWSKETRTGKTEYTLSDGTPLVLNPGNTFVQIVPTYAKATFK